MQDLQRGKAVLRRLRLEGILCIEISPSGNTITHWKQSVRDSPPIVGLKPYLKLLDVYDILPKLHLILGDITEDDIWNLKLRLAGNLMTYTLSDLQCDYVVRNIPKLRYINACL